MRRRPPRATRTDTRFPDTARFRANGDGYFRTSDTCDLDHADPFIMAIDRKLSHFLGIDPAYGEPIQGQRYAVGQEFKPHTDYFDPKGSDFEIGRAHV